MDAAADDDDDECLSCLMRPTLTTGCSLVIDCCCRCLRAHSPLCRPARAAASVGCVRRRLAPPLIMTIMHHHHRRRRHHSRLKWTLHSSNHFNSARQSHEPRRWDASRLLAIDCAQSSQRTTHGASSSCRFARSNLLRPPTLARH
jgi:hypothetical protein